jgi:hypothetical protein
MIEPANLTLSKSDNYSTKLDTLAAECVVNQLEGSGLEDIRVLKG